MPTINPDLPSNGDSAVVDVYNAAIQAILAILNGALDQDNIADGAVVLSKLSTQLQQALTPVGGILAYGGSTAPSGFLLCYGQSVLRTTYSDLFAIIGTSFGSADGTHFNLPDLRGRVPVGADAMGGTAANVSQTSTTLTTTSGSPTATVGSAANLSIGDKIVSTNVTAGTTITAISGTTITMSANANASGTTVAARFSQLGNDAQTLGAIGGTRTHTLVIAQMPSHNHTGSNYGSSGSQGLLDSVSASSSGIFATAFTGGSQPHPNMAPSQVVSYIIKI